MSFAYLEDEIDECRRQLRRVDFQLRVDKGYVESADADPADLPQIRCQVELGDLEMEYLKKKFDLLQKFLDVAGPPRETPDYVGRQSGLELRRRSSTPAAKLPEGVV